MIELLGFAFQSFWHFCGCVVLLTIAVSPVHTLFAILFGDRR